MSDSYSSVLKASRLLLRVARLLNLAAAVAFFALLLASFVLEPAFREYFSRQPGLGSDPVLPVMRLWTAAGMPVFAAVHVMLSRLLSIIGTVRAGDPFVPENAIRLRTVAWCLLAVQLFELACGIFIGVLERMGAELGEWDPSLSGWLAVLLLFVLARVFEEGARIRADLEAVV